MVSLSEMESNLENIQMKLRRNLKYDTLTALWNHYIKMLMIDAITTSNEAKKAGMDWIVEPKNAIKKSQTHYMILYENL